MKVLIQAGIWTNLFGFRVREGVLKGGYLEGEGGTYSFCFCSMATCLRCCALSTSPLCLYNSLYREWGAVEGGTYSFCFCSMATRLRCCALSTSPLCLYNSLYRGWGAVEAFGSFVTPKLNARAVVNSSILVFCILQTIEIPVIYVRRY